MEIKEYAKYNADEIRGLYSQVGWTAYTENMKALEQGYQNSLLVLAAYENGELLGIVRVVGDGFTIILIQEYIQNIKGKVLEQPCSNLFLINTRMSGKYSL